VKKPLLELTGLNLLVQKVSTCPREAPQPLKLDVVPGACVNLLESSDIHDIRYGFHEEQAFLLQNVEAYVAWCKAQRLNLSSDHEVPGTRCSLFSKMNRESKVNDLAPEYGHGRRPPYKKFIAEKLAQAKANPAQLPIGMSGRTQRRLRNARPSDEEIRALEHLGAVEQALVLRLKLTQLQEEEKEEECEEAVQVFFSYIDGQARGKHIKNKQDKRTLKMVNRFGERFLRKCKDGMRSRVV